MRRIRDWTGHWFGRNSFRSPRRSPFFQARGLEPVCSDWNNLFGSLIGNAQLVVHGIGAVCVGGMDKPLSTRPELSHVQARAPVKLRPPRRNQIVIERNQGPQCGNVPRILRTGRSRYARPSIQSRPRMRMVSRKSFIGVSPLRRKVIDRCGNASGDELLLDDFPDYFPLAAGKATADARHVDGCA